MKKMDKCIYSSTKCRQSALWLNWTFRNWEKNIFLYKQKSSLTRVSIYYSCPISSPNCRVETKNLIPLLPWATTSGHIWTKHLLFLSPQFHFTVDILAELLITLPLDNIIFWFLFSVPIDGWLCLLYIFLQVKS